MKKRITVVVLFLVLILSAVTLTACNKSRTIAPDSMPDYTFDNPDKEYGQDREGDILGDSVFAESLTDAVLKRNLSKTDGWDRSKMSEGKVTAYVGSQHIFFRNVKANRFILESTISYKANRNDGGAKAGLTVSDAESGNLVFMGDVINRKSAYILFRPHDASWDWKDEYSTIMKVFDPSEYKLTLVRDDANFYCFINDEFGGYRNIPEFAGHDSAFGFESWGAETEFSNYSYSLDDDEIDAKLNNILFDVNVAESQNGSVVSNVGSQVVYGRKLTLYVDANSGYYANEVKVNNVNIIDELEFDSMDNSFYTVSNIKSNINVTAQFSQIAAQTSTVSGQLTAKDISDVLIDDVDFSKASVQFIMGSYIKVVTPNANGTYTAEIPNGTYKIVTSLNDFITVTNRAVVVSADKTHDVLLKQMSLGSSQTATMSGEWNTNNFANGEIKTTTTAKSYIYYKQADSKFFITQTKVYAGEANNDDKRQGITVLEKDKGKRFGLFINEQSATKVYLHFLSSEKDESSWKWGPASADLDSAQRARFNNQSQGLTLTLVRNNDKFYGYLDGDLILSTEKADGDKLPYFNEVSASIGFATWSNKTKFTDFSLTTFADATALEDVLEKSVFSLTQNVGGGSTTTINKTAEASGEYQGKFVYNVGDKVVLTTTIADGYGVKSFKINGVELKGKLVKTSATTFTYTIDETNYLNADVVIEYMELVGTLKLSGAITANNYIKATNDASGAVITLTTPGYSTEITVSGNTYEITDLPEGSFTLTVKKAGFATFTKEIEISEDTVFDIALSIYGASPVTITSGGSAWYKGTENWNLTTESQNIVTNTAGDSILYVNSINSTKFMFETIAYPKFPATGDCRTGLVFASKDKSFLFVLEASSKDAANGKITAYKRNPANLWEGAVNLIPSDVTITNSENGKKMKRIRDGEKFYYFINDIMVHTETISGLNTAGTVGFVGWTNNMKFTDIDYELDSSAIDAMRDVALDTTGSNYDGKGSVTISSSAPTIGGSVTITIVVTDGTINEVSKLEVNGVNVLDKLGTPTVSGSSATFTYTVQTQRKNTLSVVMDIGAFAGELKTVTGTVTYRNPRITATGAALNGIGVSVLGTAITATTNASGEYTMQVPAGARTLVVGQYTAGSLTYQAPAKTLTIGDSNVVDFDLILLPSDISGTYGTKSGGTGYNANHWNVTNADENIVKKTSTDFGAIYLPELTDVTNYMVDVTVKIDSIKSGQEAKVGFVHSGSEWRDTIVLKAKTDGTYVLSQTSGGAIDSMPVTYSVESGMTLKFIKVGNNYYVAYNGTYLLNASTTINIFGFASENCTATFSDISVNLDSTEVASAVTALTAVKSDNTFELIGGNHNKFAALYLDELTYAATATISFAFEFTITANKSLTALTAATNVSRGFAYNPVAKGWNDRIGLKTYQNGSSVLTKTSGGFGEFINADVVEGKEVTLKLIRINKTLSFYCNNAKFEQVTIGDDWGNVRIGFASMGFSTKFTNIKIVTDTSDPIFTIPTKPHAQLTTSGGSWAEQNHGIATRQNWGAIGKALYTTKATGDYLVEAYLGQADGATPANAVGLIGARVSGVDTRALIFNAIDGKYVPQVVKFSDDTVNLATGTYTVLHTSNILGDSFVKPEKTASVKFSVTRVGKVLNYYINDTFIYTETVEEMPTDTTAIDMGAGTWSSAQTFLLRRSTDSTVVAKYINDNSLT